MFEGPREGCEYSPVPPAPPWASPATDGSSRGGRGRGGRGRAARWRAPLALALLVVGCLAAPPALVGAYVHSDILDVDGWVATVAPLASEPAVQDAVAAALSKRIAGALDHVSGSFPLPGDLGSLAEGLTGALPVEELTQELTREALASSTFAAIWKEANRAAHPLVVDAVESKADEKDRPLLLDLGAVTGAVTDSLRDAGVPLPDPLPAALRNGGVKLLDLEQLRRLGTALVTLDRLWLPLAALAVLALGGCVAIARDRLRATVFAGAGLVIAMAALEAAMAVVRGAYLDKTDELEIPHAASAAVFDTVTRDLRSWGWSVLVLGAALLVAGLLVTWVLARRPAGGRA